MQKIKVVALFGKCAAGKDTIQNWLVATDPNIKKIVSCTTRPPRDCEIDGIDYHFLTTLEFTQKVLDGSMLEAVSFRDNFYGAAIDELDENKNKKLLPKENQEFLLKYSKIPSQGLISAYQGIQSHLEWSDERNEP